MPCHRTGYDWHILCGVLLPEVSASILILRPKCYLVVVWCRSRHAKAKLLSVKGLNCCLLTSLSGVEEYAVRKK